MLRGIKVIESAQVMHTYIFSTGEISSFCVKVLSVNPIQNSRLANVADLWTMHYSDHFMYTYIKYTS